MKAKASVRHALSQRLERLVLKKPVTPNADQDAEQPEPSRVAAGSGLLAVAHQDKNTPTL